MTGLAQRNRRLTIGQERTLTPPSPVKGGFVDFWAMVYSSRGGINEQQTAYEFVKIKS